MKKRELNNKYNSSMENIFRNNIRKNKPKTTTFSKKMAQIKVSNAISTKKLNASKDINKGNIRGNENIQTKIKNQEIDINKDAVNQQVDAGDDDPTQYNAADDDDVFGKPK